jgi:CRP-like cAMP-binding protein
MRPHLPDDSDFSAALRKVPLFANLQQDEIQRLAARLRRRTFAKNSTIVWQGDAGTTLYLVEAGLMKVVIASSRGQEAVLKLLGPGDFFGDIALFDGQPRTADVVTLEASTLLLLERDALVEIIEDSPRLALGLLAALAGRLRYDVELMQGTSFLDGPGRLTKVLLQLSGVLDGSSAAPVTIPLRLTQTDLAGLVGASRESVNKWLRCFEDQGLIRRRGASITILRPDELRKRIA